MATLVCYLRLHFCHLIGTPYVNRAEHHDQTSAPPCNTKFLLNSEWRNFPATFPPLSCILISSVIWNCGCHYYICCYHDHTQELSAQIVMYGTCPFKLDIHTVGSQGLWWEQNMPHLLCMWLWKKCIHDCLFYHCIPWSNIPNHYSYQITQTFSIQTSPFPSPEWLSAASRSCSCTGCHKLRMTAFFPIPVWLMSSSLRSHNV
jgi:hypothetical protein